MRILKGIKFIIFSIISLVGIFVVTFIFAALIGSIQERFLPQDYIIWIFKFPLRNLLFIYEIYFAVLFFYFLDKGFKESVLLRLKNRLLKKNKQLILSAFAIVNIFLLYALLFNMTAITNNKIIDYTFLSPKGNQYSFKDIVKIETGVYGRKSIIPFSHYLKGDFFYIIQLNDGTKIHLTDVGGTINDKDEYSIIEKFDSQLVNMDIPKVSSMDNFQFCTKHLDKRYTDKIRNIIVNSK
ncbi:hypothetical protein EDD66_104116 [Mobilisporobacter senegalensis]|uniref:Uncharacterized protein n=1 Tax=Mobilisporobacter senegalensis TaxID=1329262 RepID=A0A3N1XTN5_9FIRM|nr:hypothetical protein [Mobilisporobacter senegalensis]ROR28532.1 hypothetical protein EDD66_104116 [Mobilisporobacter senegalensis]